jgi:hypothetical protein
MGSNFPNLVEFESEDKYLELFISEYIEKKFTTHDWKNIRVQKGHFYHIFYRDKNKPTKYFDKWLARRILHIKSIIELSSQSIEIYEWFNIKSRRNERYYVYVYWKICIFLWEERISWDYYIITAYQKNNRDLDKLRKNKQIKRIV